MQGQLLLLGSIKIVLEVLVRTIRQDNKIKPIWIEKKEVKLSLSTDVIVIYVKNLIESPKKMILVLINEFTKITEYKINLQKLILFLLLKMRNQKLNFKIMLFATAPKI